MKKYFTLTAFALLGSFILTSCATENDDRTDYDTYSVVYDLINATFSSANDFTLYYNFPSTLNTYSSDVVLVYRKKDVYSGNSVWEQIPKTVYFDAGKELDYDFDFTVNDVRIFVQGNYDLVTTTTPAGYLNNQTFRIVLVPAHYIHKSVTPIDYSDYNAVINYYNIDDTKVTEINF